MSPYLRYFILKKARGLIDIIGGLETTKRDPLHEISLAQLVKLDKWIIPGAVILSKTFGNGSNALIPGYWKHGGIVVGAETMIHAVGGGVKKIQIGRFLGSVSEAAVLWPVGLDKNKMFSCSRRAYNYLGLPYDHLFDLMEHSIYCSELIYHVYKKDLPGFQPREIMGAKTLMPSHIYSSPAFDLKYRTNVPDYESWWKNSLYDMGL